MFCLKIFSSLLVKKKNAAFEKVIRKVHLSTPQTVFGMCCGSVNKWHASPPFFAFFFFLRFVLQKKPIYQSKNTCQMLSWYVLERKGKIAMKSRSIKLPNISKVRVSEMPVSETGQFKFITRERTE